MMDRELDQQLRLALAGEDLDVSRILSNVRDEMRPPAARHHFLWSGIAAAFFLIAILSATMIDVGSRGRAIAADASCDHYKEVVRSNGKKWRTLPAEVSVYLSQRFPHAGELVSALTPPGASFEKVGTCRLEGVRYAHFVYRLGAEQVSVFVRLNEPVERRLPPFDYHDDKFGLQVATFNTPRYTGLVVCTLASSATHGISDTIARRLSVLPGS
jgi:hypothetical protein